MSELREWYVNLRTGMIARAGETRSFRGTHVIEYSAYDALKAKCERYENLLRQIRSLAHAYGEKGLNFLVSTKLGDEIDKALEAEK